MSRVCIGVTVREMALTVLPGHCRRVQRTKTLKTSRAGFKSHMQGPSGKTQPLSTQQLRVMAGYSPEGLACHWPRGIIVSPPLRYLLRLMDGLSGPALCSCCSESWGSHV